MLKLLVAVDGSEQSEHALRAAVRLAVEATAETILVNVRGTPAYYGALPPLDYPALDVDLRRQQEALLDAVRDRARAAGLRNVRVVAAAGVPAQEIARVAADEKVDQILMGTRGMTPLGGMLLGSVAQRVLHLARVPVLLVK